MKPNHQLSLALSLTVVALLTSCSRQAQVPAPNGVAQVGDAVITPAQVEQKLAERQRVQRLTALTPAHRDAALEELVQFEALFAQAQRSGWHTNAELLAGFRRAVVAKFREEQMAKIPSAASTEAEVRAYYEQHAAQFTRAAQVRGAVMLLETPAKATPEKRAEHAARAAEVRDQALKECASLPHFGAVAQRQSIDQATRYTGGDFGLLTLIEVEGRYGGALAQALAALKQLGEVSEIVETPRGLGFVKLMERRPESRRPLAEVRDGVSYQLAKARQAQAEADVLASAKRSVEVRIHRAALESISLPNRNDEPPAMPGSETAQLNHSVRNP